jgi:hypothetical protein
MFQGVHGFKRVLHGRGHPVEKVILEPHPKPSVHLGMPALRRVKQPSCRGSQVGVSEAG